MLTIRQVSCYCPPGSWFVCLGALFLVPTATVPAQEVILRDHTRLTGRTVAAFDESSIRLDDDRRLGWDQVLQAEISNDQQARFDQCIADVGLPLARIKFRLANGDWSGACRLSVLLAQRWRGQPREDAVQLVIDQMFLVSRLATDQHLLTGDRARAVLELVSTVWWQPRASKETLNKIRDHVYPDPVVKSGFDTQLLPIWFDLSQAESVYPQLLELSDSLEDPPPGIWLYLASMEHQLGFDQAASRHLKQLDEMIDDQSASNRMIRVAVDILRWDQQPSLDIADKIEREAMAADRRLWAWFQLVRYRRADPGENESQQWNRVLELINLVANEGEAAPVIAAAALQTASQLATELGDLQTADKLAQQLRRSYPQSYQAKVMVGKIESPERSQR